MNRPPETPAEPREGDTPASEPSEAQNTPRVPSGTLWAPADADASELARRQRVYAAMSRKPRASKWGRR